MTDRLANAHRIRAAAQDGNAPANRWGTVQSVNTTDMTAKVLIQPENVLTGWLPIISPMSGAGWGVLHPPVSGQQVLLAPDAGDHESYVIMGATWSDAGRPPPGSKSGELWLQHGSGASLKLLNTDGGQTTMVAMEAAGARLTLLDTGHAVIVDQSGSKFELTNDGKVLLNSELHATGNVFVTGNVNSTGTMNATGNVTTAANVIAAGNMNAGGNVAAGGNVTAGGTGGGGGGGGGGTGPQGPPGPQGPAGPAGSGTGANVISYGAIGDGVADDTAAINDALAANCAVYFPEGTYKISGTLNITRNGAHLFGAGRQATIIISNSTTAPVFIDSSFLTGVIIEHMTIDRSVTPTAGANGITNSVSSQFTKYSNLVIQNHWIGIALGPTGYSYIENVVSMKNVTQGFYLTNTAQSGALQWSFANCLATQNGTHGFMVFAVNNGPIAIALGEFKSCSSYANVQSGFAAVGLAGCPIYGVRITGGFFGSDGNHEVFLDTFGGEHQLIGVFTELSGTGATGPTLGSPRSNIGSGFNFTANNLDINCMNCYAEGHSQSGFRSGATEATFTGCKAMSNGVASITNDRNGFTVFGGQPSFFGSRAGNIGTTSQENGIQINNATAGALIWGADLRGNTVLPINVLAGLAGLTLGGTIPAGNVLLPAGGISVGNPTGGAVVGGVNVASDVQKNGTVYTNP